MANRAKALGTSWESAVRDYLNTTLGLVDESGRFRDVFSALNVKRPAQEGAADVGDVHAVPFVLECKNVKNPAVPTFLRQAETEANHAGFPYGVAVVKVRGLNVRRGRVHYTLPTWHRIRHELGLPAQEFGDRWSFRFSTRGDESRWYATHDLEQFADLLTEIRGQRHRRQLRAFDSL